MAKDQSDEHSNKEMKTDGGYTNLNVNDPITLLIQTVASLQRAELISKFEEGMLMHPNLNEYSPYRHHEESYAFQVRFHAHAKALVEVLRPINPYMIDMEFAGSENKKDCGL